jgi:hypothetical protein
MDNPHPERQMAVARDQGKHVMRAINSLRLIRLLKALQWLLVWAASGDETAKIQWAYGK